MADPRFYLTAPPLEVAQAAAIAGARLVAMGTRAIARVAAIDDAAPDDAALFIDDGASVAKAAGRRIGLCIVRERDVAGLRIDGALAVASAPKLAHARLAAALHRERPFDRGAGVDRSASIGEGARIHETATIAAGAKIGTRVAIGPHAAIGPGVEIGADCEIGPGVIITNALVGARCVFLAGAAIGQSGFGYVAGPDGLVRIPQLGRVVIGDDVDIGANTTVDRGALGDTLIGRGAKIDNLVQIGHNVRIGPDTVIAAQTGVSGSTVIGRGVRMGGQAGLADHVTVGDGAELAAQSGVMRDIPAGERWGGSPARPIRAMFREVAALARLGERGRGARTIDTAQSPHTDETR